VRERRARLRELVQETSTSGPDGVRGTKAASEMMSLLGQEGLNTQGYRVQACYHAFQCLLRAGSVEEARSWGEEAASHCILCRGVGHGETLMMQGFARDPQSHPAAPSTDMLPTVAFVLGSSAMVAGAYVFLSR